jgi:hypothetical protein
MDLYASFHSVSGFFTDNKELLTIGGAAVGGGLALVRFWRDRSWDKKQFAYDYAERVFGDARTMTALRMLDWSNGSIPEELAKEYELVGDRAWTQQQVADALRLHDDANAGARAFTHKEYVIRELFDACLARFERLGHFVDSGVISARDLPTTLAYYPQIMVEARLKVLREPLERYMKRYKFDHACTLFRQLAKIATKDGPASDGPGMAVGRG